MNKLPFSKKKNIKIEPTMQSSIRSAGDIATADQGPESKTKKDADRNMDIIDKISGVLFPMVYILFNVVYAAIEEIAKVSSSSAICKSLNDTTSSKTLYALLVHSV